MAAVFGSGYTPRATPAALAGELSTREKPAFVLTGGRARTRRARTMTERLLNAAEVAELLAVPESWVREHTRSGSLPHIQLGRYIRYRREAILTWLESREGADRWSRRAAA